MTTIRPMQRADLNDLASFCFPELPLDEVRERVEDDLAAMAQGEGATLVAEEAGRVGMTARLLPNGAVGWIFNVASHGDFRGRGILQLLLADMEKRGRDMGLARLAIHVREDNPRARRAYEKAGFKLVGSEGMHGAQLRYEKELA